MNEKQKWSQAVQTKKHEDDRVCVSEWRFAPGSATGWHRHAFDYVVVPMTTGRLLIETKPSEEDFYRDLTEGDPYAGPVGVEHDVINDSDKEVVFIEIELK